MIAEKASVYNSTQQAFYNINPILHKCKQTMHLKFWFNLKEKKAIKKHVPISVGNSIRNSWLRPQ